MIGRFYISLSEHEFKALQEEARRELRGVKDQATFYILRGLNIVDSQSTVTHKEGQQDESRQFITA